MKKPFSDTKFGKLLNSKGGKIVKGLVIDGLQAVPVVGTIVTNLKTDTEANPAGKLKLSKWDIYRILVGIGAAYALHKGILTQDHISFLMNMIGM
jgi:hypothetical protein